MQLEIDAIKKAAAWLGPDRRIPAEGGAAVPLMGPADHGSASPLMGPATAGTPTPLMGPADPATVTPLGPPIAARWSRSWAPPTRHGHAADAPKPVMPHADRRTDVSPGPAAVRQAGPGEPGTSRHPLTRK